jgi:hypothetical protein
MKRLLGVDLDGSWTFTPGIAGAGTIAFNGVTLGLNQILLITNTTQNTIIYNFADATKGAASYSGGVLTLDASTAGQGAGDSLQIYVDVDEPMPMAASGELIEAIEALRFTVASLTRTLNASIPDASGRQRVNVETGVVASGTLTTCSTVTNLTQIGAVDARTAVNDLNKFAADSLRRNIATS